MAAKYVCIDLDGTIAHYKEWISEDHFGEVIEGAKEALEAIRQQGWTIIIFTTRGNRDKIKQYLINNQIPYDYINENPDQPADAEDGKLYAEAYIDDRAIQFKGDWQETVAQLAHFQPWEMRTTDKPYIAMSNSETFLERDFSQHFQQLQHYDQRLWDVIKFSFIELLSGVTAAAAIYVFAFTENDTPDTLVNNWQYPVAGILGLTALFTLLSIVVLAKLSVSFAKTANDLNEDRRFFLSANPLGAENKDRDYTGDAYPGRFDPLSTPLLGIYFIAFAGSLICAVAVGLLFGSGGTLSDTMAVFGGLFYMALTVGIVAYLFKSWRV